jgi:hypothetical protein
MSVITVRANTHEDQVFREYSLLMGKPVSTLLKESLWDRIETELDLQAARQALAESDGQTVPLAAVLERLGLDQADSQ